MNVWTLKRTICPVARILDHLDVSLIETGATHGDKLRLIDRFSQALPVRMQIGSLLIVIQIQRHSDAAHETQQKFLKRPADDIDSASDSFEQPPVKLQHNGSENLTKFSVEIVQQLEFTTSAANSQPQQISTNVTVKALTNASVKSEGSAANGGPGGGIGGTGGGNGMPGQQQQQPNNNPTPSPHMHDLGNIVDFKQEPENEFADLSAALEKDAAANGHFPGLDPALDMVMRKTAPCPNYPRQRKH
uniref:Uncharacterized protein n=1 Tax=Anopheles farauti TaxID=69004 RepID=A0A182QXS6_9DIPT